MITLTGGRIQNQSGMAVPNGSISFQLNLDATVLGVPGGLIPASQVVTVQFDASGDLVQPAQIYSNAELSPQNASGLGTYYLVSIYDANGAPLNASPLYWQFTAAASATVDISNMTPFFTRGAVIYYADRLSATAAGQNTQVQFNASGLLGASANLTFDPNSNVLGVAGDISLTGKFVDSLASPGSNGQLLSSTGSATRWTANLTWDSDRQLLTALGGESTFSGVPFGQPTTYVAVGSTNFSEVQQTPIVFTGIGSLSVSGQSPWWLHPQSLAGPLVEINVDENDLASNLVLTNNSAGPITLTGTALIQGDDGSFNLLNKNKDGDALWLVMSHGEGISLQFSGAKTFNVNLDPTTGAWYPGNNSGVQPLGTTTNPWGVLILGDATPTVAAGQIGLGNTTGVGNGLPVTSYSAPALGTGSGPADPGTVVLWEQVNVGGTFYWRPLFQ